MLERGNRLKALQGVEASQGAAGVDGLEVKPLQAYLREPWFESESKSSAGTMSHDA